MNNIIYGIGEDGFIGNIAKHVWGTSHLHKLWRVSVLKNSFLNLCMNVDQPLEYVEVMWLE